MPEGAVYVGRGSKWGNPYPVDELCHADLLDLIANDRTRLVVKRPQAFAVISGLKEPGE